MKTSNLLPILIVIFLISCGKKKEETVVERKDITELLFASGTLEAEDEYNLTAEVEGHIVKLSFDEGNDVKEGEVFAIIRNRKNVTNAAGSGSLLAIAKENATASAPQLQQLQANVDAAHRKVEQDRKQEERYRTLLENNSISKLEYENVKLSLDNSEFSLKAAEEKYSNLLIQSRQQVVIQQQQHDVNSVNMDHNNVRILVAGKVLLIKKKLGDYVRKGEVIATIGNPEKAYAYLSIDESNMGKVAVGQEVYVRLNTNREKVYTAKVGEIKPIFDEKEQSFFLKAFFTDHPEFQLPGTQLEANIKVGEKEDALVIPYAFLGYGNKVVLEDNSRKAITVGIVSSEWVEVLEGLELGQTIKRELD